MAGQCDPSTRGHIVVERSLLEQNRDISLFVHGSDAVVDASVIRATEARAPDQLRGRGVHIQPDCVEAAVGLDCDPATAARLDVVGSVIDDHRDFAVAAIGSTATVVRTVVRGTRAREADGFFGDGVTAVGFADAPAAVTMTRSLIADSARAGFSNFGAHASLGFNRIRCAAFSVAAETHEGAAFSFEDAGVSLCGCPDAVDPCKATSAGLAPPTAGN
jgi:hypothetical protein